MNSDKVKEMGIIILLCVVHFIMGYLSGNDAAWKEVRNIDYRIENRIEELKKVNQL